MSPETERESLARVLYEAEQNGLRLAIRGRLVAIVLLAVWFVTSRSADPMRVLEFVAALGVFALLGSLHYRIIGSADDRPWVKYLFITVDMAI